MSAAQYGAYALSMATIGLCASIFYQWIAVTIARFYSIYAKDPAVLIAEGNKLFFRVSLCVFFAIAVYISFAEMETQKIWLTVAIAVSVVATGLHNLGLQIANASGRPANYGLLSITRGAFTLCAAVGLVQLGYGSTGAVFGFAVGGVLSVAIFRVKRPKFTEKSNKTLRKEMMVYGLPLTLTYVSTMILDVSDRFMIGWWLGTPAVAGYAAAYDLTQQVIGAIMNVLFLASYPRITAAWETGGVSAARDAMSPLSRAILLASPLLSGIFIGGATEISNAAFGKAIASEAAKVIPWTAFAITVACFKSYYLDVAFQLEKATKTQLYITACMAILNILLNLFLINRYGILGAAISTAAAFTFGAMLSWQCGRKLNLYSSRMLDLAKLLIIFFFILIATSFLPTTSFSNVFNAAISVTVGVVSYTIGILIFNPMNIRSAAIRQALVLMRNKIAKH